MTFGNVGFQTAGVSRRGDGGMGEGLGGIEWAKNGWGGGGNRRKYKCSFSSDFFVFIELIIKKE